VVGGGIVEVVEGSGTEEEGDEIFGVEELIKSEVISLFRYDR
jgi:hypothetical protein